MKAYKILRIAALILFSGIIISPGIAQTTSSPITVVPPSPNAASIMKFSDIPVSAYTGVPSVEVPLYTIQSGDITVPISLSYHASGIRLAEEAGNVGLGWALNAGGAVSRSILGKDDFGGGYFQASLPEIDGWPSELNAYMNNISGYDLSLTDPETKLGKNISLSAYLSPEASKGYNDIEPDLYSFSFPGHGGKFIIRRNREVLMHKPEDIKVDFEQGGANFSITDENGLSYLFKDLEKSSSGAPTTSSWLLSEIKSPKLSVVKFFYKQQTWVSVQGTYSQVNRLGCTSGGFESSQSDQITYQNILLDSIAFDNGYAKFIYEGNREDLEGGSKLTQLKVYATQAASQPAKLLKEYRFQYSYFNNGMTAHVRGYKRLKLESVTEMSGAIQLPPYRFVYTEPSNTVTSLTHKQSNSIDHWGYYNGYGNGFDPNKPSLSNFIPRYRGRKHEFNISGQVVGESYVDLPGANRSPDAEKMKLFSLSEIIYPTGGKTKFELEAHDFDEAASQNGYQYEDEMELVEKEAFLNFSQSGRTLDALDLSKRFGNEIKVAVTFRYSCTGGADCTSKFNSIGYGKVYFDGLNHHIDIKNLSCPDGVCTTGLMSTTLGSGSSFPVEAYIDNSVSSFIQGIYVRVIWTELKRIQSTYPDERRFSYAGGLRVGKITSFDQSGKVAKTRKYDYHFSEDRDLNGVPETYSYGRRMSPPSYYRYEWRENHDGLHCQKCASLTRYSSSVSTLSNSAQGSVVGYDKVTEYTVDDAGVSLGKTEYFYENEADGVLHYKPGQSEVNARLPGIPNNSNNRNGLLTSKIDFASTGAGFIKVQETTNLYTSSQRAAVFTFRYDDPGPLCNSGQSANHVLLYPALLSERILLTLTTTKNFDKGDETKYSATTQEYHYDNPSHSMPTRVITHESDGAVLTTVNKYPLDQIAGLSAAAEQARKHLVSQHVISPVLEQSITKGSGVVSVGRTNYKIFENGLALPESVETQQGSGPLEKRVGFQHYDDKGNLIQQAKSDDIALSYIWDDKKTHPIAIVRNASKNTVFHTSFEESGTEGPGAKTGKRYNTGNYLFTPPAGFSSLPGSTLSYWRWSNATSKWTLVEQSYAGGSVTCTGDKVDEVRVTPPGAEMTTYTHAPLLGVTSVTDPNNRTTYYEYDGLGRLQLVRDQDGNITKSHEYQYMQ